MLVHILKLFTFYNVLRPSIMTRYSQQHASQDNPKHCIIVQSARTQKLAYLARYTALLVGVNKPPVELFALVMQANIVRPSHVTRFGERPLSSCLLMCSQNHAKSRERVIQTCIDTSGKTNRFPHTEANSKAANQNDAPYDSLHANQDSLDQSLASLRTSF